MAKGTNSSSHRSPRGQRAHGRLGPVLCLVAFAALGTACGDYGGGSSSNLGGVVTSGGLPNTPGDPGGTGGGATTEENITAFSQTVHPILRDNCVDCHAGSGPGTPHIANADAAVAYAAVVDNQKVNLGNPEQSRLVRRLVADFHHCWSNCVMDGAQMQAAIQAWADMVDFGGGGTTVAGIVSNSLGFSDGFEDEGQERYRDNVIALYEFKEGEGTVAADTSGVDPAMDLALEGSVEWMSNYGLSFEEGRAMASRESSRKLFDRIAEPNGGSQQFSVEAWVIPGNVDQEGPARIISYSRGTGQRNFHLGQVLYNYNFRNRTILPEVDDNGRPALQTPDAEQDLQATQQHVVVTYDQYRGRRIYVNGRWTDDEDPVPASRLWNWDPEFNFVLGNETSSNRPWEGRVQLVVVYDVALTDAQITQNFNAGVGKRLVFRFDVSQWTGPGTFIEFVVSELDEYSYLFCTPTFISPGVTNLRLSNMRIVVNGQIPVSGQAFVNVDAQITSTRQELSPQCSVIPKDAGPDSDVFALDFEYLGEFENPIVPPPPGPLPPREFGEALPTEGVRSFERVNETMAILTGVDPNASGPQAAFAELTQQLPGGVDLRAFSSSQQVAISKLSLEYCDTLIETPALRGALFPGFPFDQPATVAYGTPASRDLLIDPLVDRMSGVNVANQPSRAEVRPILDGLIDELILGCDAATCGADRTRTVGKAVCSALLSSAAVSMH